MCWGCTVVQTTTHSPPPCNSQSGRKTVQSDLNMFWSRCQNRTLPTPVPAPMPLSPNSYAVETHRRSLTKPWRGWVGRRLLKEINVGTIQILLFACKHSFRVPSLPYSYASQAPLGHPEFSGPSWWNRKYFLYFLFPFILQLLCNSISACSHNAGIVFWVFL